eukprot:s141_g30.t1
MSTLAAQFKDIAKAQKKEINQEVNQSMTLQELETEKILFGEAKKGKTFAEAFKDTAWVEFILSRFETSGKSEHMMFIQYVKLRMADMTNDIKELPVKKPAEPKSGYKKPSTQSDVPPVPSDVWEELQITEGDPMMSEMLVPQLHDEMQDLRQSNMNLHNRVGQVEMVMQEILEHVRKMTVKQET